MFIQTETTPNPDTLKFLPGQTVLPEGTAEFTSVEAAEQGSLLAHSLFRCGSVTRVLLGQDFVAVTKEPAREWMTIKPLLLGAIMDHFVSQRPVLSGDAVAPKAAAQHAEATDEITQQIIEILDTRVRPAVAQDGGDITFDRFEDGILYLEMRGACSGCPSSTATLKHGIENMMKHFVPQVQEVRSTAA